MPATTTIPTTLSDVSKSIFRGARPSARLAHRNSPGSQDRPGFVRLAVGLAATRVLLGCAALVVPEAAGRAWIGQGASGRDRAVLVRALAGRDIALGLGALLALRSKRDVSRWLLMGAASDLVDTAGSAAGFGALPPRRRWLVLAASGGAACAGVVLAGTLPTPS